ncbi:MAG: phosphoribosyltransferase family protein [Candidatus Nezhaarchaeales archaeon]
MGSLRLSQRGKLVYSEELLGKFYVFKDRLQAGILLGRACRQVVKEADYVLAVPMGGIPVGLMVSKILKAKFDIIICRKLLIPWNREAGFGAVGPDGSYFVDQAFARSLGLSSYEIEEAVREQIEEIRKRNELLRQGRDYPLFNDLKVILIDDGAAGYTMRAAVDFVKSRGAREVIIAVPTGCLESLLKLSEHVSLIVCLNIRSGPWFAVADAYQEWRDLDYEYVMRLMKEYEGESLPNG